MPIVPICHHKPTTVGPWLLAEVTFCKDLPGGKYSLPPQAECIQLLDRYASHQGSIAVFTDGSKPDEGVEFGVMFSSFSRGVSLPSVSSVFMAELSAILYDLTVISTLLMSSFIIF